MADVIDLGNPNWVTLTADATTPANLLPHNGKIIAVPTHRPDGTPITVTGGIDVLRINGVNVPGYLAESPTGYLWIMRPTPDPNVVMFENLPGAGGWADPDARQTWATIGLALLARGVTGEEIRSGFPALYGAAVANYLAQQA